MRVHVVAERTWCTEAYLASLAFHMLMDFPIMNVKSTLCFMFRLAYCTSIGSFPMVFMEVHTSGDKYLFFSRFGWAGTLLINTR